MERDDRARFDGARDGGFRLDRTHCRTRGTARMMRLSRKTLLALEAVIDIAYNARPEPVQAKEITARQGVPQRYLEQVMQQLVRAGILKGVRGPARRLPPGARAAAHQRRRRGAHRHEPRRCGGKLRRRLGARAARRRAVDRVAAGRRHEEARRDLDRRRLQAGARHAGSTADAGANAYRLTDFTI